MSRSKLSVKRRMRDDLTPITGSLWLRLIFAAGLSLSVIVQAPSVWAQPSSKSPLRIVRPRMLIGEHDPLTGFTVLRARYAAGARPSDDIAGWALSYLVTGEESFVRQAVEEL